MEALHRKRNRSSRLIAGEGTTVTPCRRLFSGLWPKGARGIPLLLALALVPLFAGPSSAWLVYPYRPYAVYRPLDTLPPTGAALGPWPWSFEVGGGPTPLLGSARDQLSSGVNFTIGGGYNFTPRSGLLLEYSDSWLGVTDAALAQNQATDGDAHVWSITLNPIWRFRIGGPVGGYLIGGGGYYERDKRFDEPVQVFVPTSHGGFYDFGIERVDQSDGAGGVNAGAGLTCNLGGGTKLFVEVRYHHVFTSGTATQLLPVTIGFRW